eukprot:5866969-Karenia_brevis.AAC.1
MHQCTNLVGPPGGPTTGCARGARKVRVARRRQGPHRAPPGRAQGWPHIARQLRDGAQIGQCGQNSSKARS